MERKKDEEEKERSEQRMEKVMAEKALHFFVWAEVVKRHRGIRKMK